MSALERDFEITIFRSWGSGRPHGKLMSYAVGTVLNVRRVSVCDPQFQPPPPDPVTQMTLLRLAFEDLNFHYPSLQMTKPRPGWWMVELGFEPMLFTATWYHVESSPTYLWWLDMPTLHFLILTSTQSNQGSQISPSLHLFSTAVTTLDQAISPSGLVSP